MTYNLITTTVYVCTVIRKTLTQLNYHSLTVNFVVMQISIIFYVNIIIFLIFNIFSIYLQY